VAFSLLSDLTPDLSHTLALEYQDEHEDSPYWGTPVLNPQGWRVEDRQTQPLQQLQRRGRALRTAHDLVRSIIDYRINDSTTLRNTLYHLDSQRDYRNLETYQYNADNSAVNRSTAYQVRHRVSRTATSSNCATTTGFRSRHDVVRWFRVQGQPDHQLAAEYQRREHRRSEQLPPGHFYDIPGTNPALISDKTNEVTTKALFAENRLALTDKLALLTGLRYDDIDLDVTNHRTVTATNPKHLKRSWEPVTGRVGLTCQFIPSANVYVQYSTAAEQPNGTQDSMFQPVNSGKSAASSTTSMAVARRRLPRTPSNAKTSL
jgi:iron complex outermembrane receptor protein